MYNNPDIFIKAKNGKICATIEKDIENKLIYINWTWKYSYGHEVLKEALIKAVDFMTKNNIYNSISDASKLTETWDPINDWIANIWTPMALKSGVTLWVMLKPMEFFAEITNDIMVDEIEENGLTITSVDSIENAIKWLESKRQVTD